MPQNVSSPPENSKSDRFGFGRRPRLPLILQAETAECGLACVAMIACYHGHETSLSSLRQSFAISGRGADLKQVIDISGCLGFSPRPLRLELDELPELQTPCILHWQMNHFVVLAGVKNGHAVIFDPAAGKRTVNQKELNENFTGVALELAPTKAFRFNRNKEKLRISDFWSQISGLKRNLAQLILFGLLLQFFAILAPFFMQLVIDEVLLSNDLDLLLVLALGFGLLLLIEVGTSVLRDLISLRFSNSLNLQIATNLFRHLIRLPTEYFSKRHMGDIVSRFGSLEKIREIITNNIVTAVLDGLLVILTLIVMFFYNVQLTSIVLAATFCYGMLRYFFYNPIRRLTDESIHANAKTSSHFMESVRAIETVKLFQKEGDRQGEWNNYFVDTLNKMMRREEWNIGFRNANRLLFGLESLLVIYFGALAVMGNLLSIGMLYAFISYKTRFEGSVQRLIEAWISYKLLDVHLDRLSDIVFTEAENTDRFLQQSVPTQHDGAAANDSKTRINADRCTIRGKLEARGLSYTYGPNEDPVFQSLDFVIEAGQTVAIIGPSGSGKSTLMKCLTGLFEPTAGEILVDGKPLAELNEYRSQIAGVMQVDQLMTGTIAENIACFAPRIDMEKVRHCARLACIDREIEATTMQYNTLVGDMGSTLSGGQLQRILLARALYREPRILFLDEATSHLDLMNESLVNEHIKQLKITRVIVAHRPETIRSADRQIVLA